MPNHAKTTISTPNFPLALAYDDVLLVPQHSFVVSRSHVDLTTKINKNLTLKIPLISTNMDTVTGVEMAVAMHNLGGMGILQRFHTPDEQADRVKKIVEQGAVAAASIGINGDAEERAEKLVKAGATVLNIDVAHGHMQTNIEFTQKIKNRYGDSISLISGIVATGNAADALYTAGADSLYVGIGGGSTCTTRVMTGSGLPTFASCLDVAPVARKHKKTFIPCAGTKTSGDIVKALAAGGSAVACGSIFAGTDEAPGELIEIDGKKYKEHNGSASHAEKKKHLNKIQKEDPSTYVAHVEGAEGLIEYKGSVVNVVNSLLAGIRSGFSYSGAANLMELWEKASFVQITPAGKAEGSPHTITVKN